MSIFCYCFLKSQHKKTRATTTRLSVSIALNPKAVYCPENKSLQVLVFQLAFPAKIVRKKPKVQLNLARSIKFLNVFYRINLLEFRLSVCMQIQENQATIFSICVNRQRIWKDRYYSPIIFPFLLISGVLINCQRRICIICIELESKAFSRFFQYYRNCLF